MSALFHSYLCGRIAAEWLIAMIYTNEEAAMIDGMIGTLFGGANVAENVRDAYQTVRRHLTEGSLDQKDLSRISAAVDFALKNQFCDSCSKESQRVLTTILIKTVSSA